MRSRGPLACSGLLVAFFLSACTGGLYTAEGLPPLDAGGGPPCDTSYFCDVGGTLTCVSHDLSHCDAACNPCPAQVANGNAWTCDPAGQVYACSFSCRDGFLKNAATRSCELATSLVAGDSHTCAITASGLLKCWGSNAQGQVTGTAGGLVSTPHDLASGASAAAAGPTYTCAVISGGVQCWGAVPAGTPPSASVLALAAGASHACALLGGGTVQCWGTGAAATSPPGLAGVTAVTSGANHACAVHAGGVTCWGENGLQQTGGGAVLLAGAGIDRIAAGRDFTCAASSTGTDIACWGDNGAGQLPLLSVPTVFPPDVPKRTGGGGSPRPITKGDAISVLVTGARHTCVVLLPPDGIACFGEDAFSKLGGQFVGEAVTSGEPNATILAAGGDHTCAVFPSDGLLRCWGRNDSGQLGGGNNLPVAAAKVLVSGK